MSEDQPHLPQPADARLQILRAHLSRTDLEPEERAYWEDILLRAERGEADAVADIDRLEVSRSYEPLPGTDVALAPGPAMVCPIDPEHYRTYQREIGDVMHCPQHGVPLVLAPASK